MAISIPGIFTTPGGGSPSTPPPLPFDRARAQKPLPEVPQNPASGSLVIVDYFQDSYEGAAHGNVGAYAARQHGFRGEIYAEKIGADTPGISQTNLSWESLRSGPKDPAATRQSIQDISRHSQRELLEDVTGDLDKIRGRGLKDSAVNVSYGVQPQRIAEDIYKAVRTAPSQDPKANQGGGMAAVVQSLGGPTEADKKYQFAQNVLNGYGVDQQKFYSPDPKINGPERLRLQQGLLNSAEAGGQAPDVQAAKATYEESVKALEANNNSVVVSVGNQGQLLDRFAKDANGARVTAGETSNHNVLVNSHVTTVGATRWYDNGTERIAAYNNKDPETDLYASGSVGNGADQNQMRTLGTSYASPRVAGALATLHGNHPGMTSSSVENLMRNRLTHDLDGKKVMDFQLAEEYMRRGTF